ncbi:hypothetical protein PIB30_089649 [Stylosanthes scabra]|uniref:Transposase (Putative), gypsy type n=1 Tax=Stylosanthes scabra TaxID=79078 RepID=A0ABU6YT14_9FABA|nr:hypothetical protein [Stylosanthes scabra]
MAKKKSCQNIYCPRVLSVAERELYGWVDKEVFSQSSVGTSDMLPELCREMRLTEGGVSEEDYVIEAPGPSDRLPFQVAEDRTHFLWVYTELFSRLFVQLPFIDFQKEVMTRCRVAASQLHLDGWGFLCTFKRVCLHFGFQPSCTLLSLEGVYVFLCSSGRKLFDAFEESIQEFKWHYFKIFPLPIRRPFWLDDEGKPFAWGVGPRSILPSPKILTATAGASASTLAATVPPSSSSSATKSKKKPPATSTEKPISLEGKEGAKEDPSTDLRQKRRKRKVQESFPEDAAVGADAAWEHEVSPLDRAFPTGFNFWVALDSGLTQGSVREALGPMVPQQLLGTAQQYTCKLTACLQVGIENAFAAKLKMEKELAAPRISGGGEQGVGYGAPILPFCLGAGKKKVEFLTRSLEQKQTTLREVEAPADHWRQEWKELAEETREIVQETFKILMDQVRHLNLVVDFSVITLDTRWDPNGQRIYNHKAEAKEQSEPMVEEPPEPVAQEQPDLVVEEQQMEEVVPGEGGGNPT